jgi:ADP-heptose:LPS heptosyltransferase
MKSIEAKIRFLFIRLIAPAAIKIIFSLLPRKEKTLLIVRSDGVGDYLLFRNYLYFLRKSKKYRDHEIYILENFISKDLALHWDVNIVDRFIWYSDGNFLKWDLIKLLWKLQTLRVETIIYTNYSRKFTVDWLIDKVNAKKKVSVDGDCINRPLELKDKSDRYYSELIPLDHRPLHEFERNKEIFELICGEKCDFERPFVEVPELNIKLNNSVVIFAGAGHDNKKWDVASFNRICVLITQELKLPVILAAAKHDRKQIAEISKGIATDLLSCRYELNLIELCELIAGAEVLITGDTAAVHIAAVLGVPAVCIAKGDLYGRFIPYPKYIVGHITCIFPAGYNPEIGNHNRWSAFTINDVGVDQVFAAIVKKVSRLIETKN